MKQLINYKVKAERLAEYPYVTLLVDREVLLGIPVCAIDFGREYQKPVLYGDQNGIPTVYEESEVKTIIAQLKVFHLKNDQGKLTEVDEIDADLHVRLPKDTKVDQLVYDNGQLYWAKPVEENEDTQHGDN